LSLSHSFRVSTARDRAEQADLSANQAREDSELARVMAKQFAPEFYKGLTSSNSSTFSLLPHCECQLTQAARLDVG